MLCTSIAKVQNALTATKLAVIAGDGIGPEVVAEGLLVLRAALEGAGEKLETIEYDLGGDPIEGLTPNRLPLP